MIGMFWQVFLLGALGGFIYHLRSKHELQDVEYLLEHIFLGGMSASIIVFLTIPTSLALYLTYTIAIVAGFGATYVVEPMVKKILVKYGSMESEE